MPVLAASIVLWFILLAVILIVLLVRRFGRPVRLPGRFYPTVDKFVEQFGAELGLKGEKLIDAPFVSRLSDARFTGKLASGLASRVTFMTQKPDGEDLEQPNAVFAVECAKVPQLTVTVKGFLGRLGQAVGLTPSLVAGERAFDDRYAVETLEPGRAKVELAKPAFREAIESVFAHYKLAQLELARGEIVAHVPVRDLAPEHYAKLLERLGVLARTIDALIVKVQQGELTGAKCGYCHEEIAADAPDLVACEVCSTVTHKACRAELGRCPVAGCEGKVGERPRVRA